MALHPGDYPLTIRVVGAPSPRQLALNQAAKGVGRAASFVQSVVSVGEGEERLILESQSGARVSTLELYPSYVDVTIGPDRRGASPSDWVMSCPDRPMRGEVRNALKRWVHAFSPAEQAEAARRHRNAVERAIEILIGDVQRLVLDNESLLRELAERDRIVDQLEGQVRYLTAELRAVELRGVRVRPGVQAVRELAIAFVASFAGAAAPLALTQAEVPQQDAGHVIVTDCDDVLGLLDEGE